MCHATAWFPRYLPDGKENRGAPVSDLREVGPQAHRRDGPAGRRCRSAQHQPVLVGAERDVAAEIVRMQNEDCRNVRGYPRRFVAFASVALQYPDLAVRQLEHGVKKLGLRGAAVGASVAGEEFSEKKFHPFWAKAEELGVLIFIHPQSTPELAKRFKGNGWLANTIGNPLAAIASRLIFEHARETLRGPGSRSASEQAGLPAFVRAALG